MHSISRSSVDGSSSPPPGVAPSSSAAPKRRYRADSNPAAAWGTPTTGSEHKRQRSDTDEPGLPIPPPATLYNHAATPGTVLARTSPVYTMSLQRPKRREVIDLTQPKRRSAFQPHTGAKKLVIKNLRAPSRRAVAEIESYYARTLSELESALDSFLASQRPRLPLERLYRGVEDICRHGEAEKLFEKLKDRCERHVAEELLVQIEDESGSGSAEDDVNVLRRVLAHWKTWCEQSALIRSTFSYLDRSFLLGNKALPQINDMFIQLFKWMVFTAPSKNKDGRSESGGMGYQVLDGMCKLVDYDRRGDAAFDSSLLKESVTMLHVFNSYDLWFESRFLEESARYFEDFAEERSAISSLKDYIVACDNLLEREEFRCNVYNLDSTTKRQLLGIVHTILIDKYSSKLLDSGSVAKLLDENAIAPMRALHQLLMLSGIQHKLKEPWESYIRQTGTAIVTDVSRGDDMVLRLLELRRRLEVMIRDAFYGSEEFTFGLREAFGQFINDRKTGSSWGTGTSKVGEMIAKYIDMLLRGGLKTLPKALLSDNKDRAAAEQSGLASTGDEDAELDRQLDQALELFRFIDGKDVFEAFYKKDLARRLLMGRSASQDAERNMLTKLKSECGSSFTHNLEQMFKDQELARDEMASYKEWKEGTGSSPGDDTVDLHVSILSAAAWPTYPEVQVLLPPEVLEQIQHFDRYYINKHTGRRLTWKHNLAHCVVKARFDRGTKELLVSAFQAVVLALFNQVADPKGFLSYEQIAQATGLAGAELDRTLQSLACGKARVLTKHPRGRDVAPTDTFTVNGGFVDPKYRVKINQIQLRETKEENRETHQRVAADRQFETQAAIVRVMKSRKNMTHAQLVAEVINQTKSRGAVDAAEIKKNIEKLIEKDYLEREGGSYTYLA